MSEEKIKKIIEIFEDFKAEFKKDENGKKIWEEGQALLTPYMMDWAKAKYFLLMGSEEDKEVAKEIIIGIERSIADIVLALSSRLKNYLLDKLELILKGIVVKHLLPILLKSVI